MFSRSIRKFQPGFPLEFRRDRTTLDQTAGFDPEDLVGRVIAEPLASQIASAPDASYDIIVVFDTGNPQGVASARKAVAGYLDLLGARTGTKIDYQATTTPRTRTSTQR